MSDKIRVAHVITNFVVGGAQDYMILLVKGLDRKKFQPYILGKMEGEWVATIKSLPDVVCVDIPALHREISLMNDLRALFQIWRACKKHNIDIVHTHSSKPGIIGRMGAFLAGVRGTVHTIHGFSFNEFMPRIQKIFYIFLEILMMPFTSVLVLYSKENYRTAKRLHIGAKHSVEMFYYGIDYSPFKKKIDREEIKKNIGLTKDDYVIGFTGRFMEQKGLPILIEAFSNVKKQHTKIKLLLVGDGALRAKLESQISSLGLLDSVIITGFRSDVPDLLRTMDLFVMTSLWEGLSRSLAEAMFAQLPIIATDVGGTSDAIRNDETGWLVCPNNVNAVTNAIVDAIENPKKSKLYSENGFHWAMSAFNVDLTNIKIQNIYSDLILGKRIN